MFNCSASVCSSATDFCFSSAISTDETPGKRARPACWRAMRVGGMQDPVRLTVYVMGPAAAERAVQAVTGSFLPNQEALQLRSHRGASQVALGALRNSRCSIIFQASGSSLRHCHDSSATPILHS